MSILRNFTIMSLAAAVILIPQAILAEMSGGNFQLFADQVSVISDDRVSGGNYTVIQSGEHTGAGSIGKAAQGTITVSYDGSNSTLGEEITISDGRYTTIFFMTNMGGTSSGNCAFGQSAPCQRISVDIGGGFGENDPTTAARFVDALNSENHLLTLYATSTEGVIYLTNTLYSDSRGNVPMSESGDVNELFDLSGMSGGSDSGYILEGGYQAMDRSGISFSVSDSSMALGQLSASTVSSDSTVLTVTTDSSSGYTVTVTEDGNLRDGANTIDDVSDGTVSSGSEEYGIRTVGGGGQLANDTAITGGNTTVAYSGSAKTNEQTTVQFRAAVDSSQTLQGNYSHIVTFSAVANP